ncbi:MAG: hypothetical protein ACFCU3_10685 [Verrucomicrobiales bacterium]
MNDDLSNLDESELKRRLFGTFPLPGEPERSGGEKRPSFDTIAEYVAQTIICLKCKKHFAVRWNSVDEFLAHAVVNEPPKVPFCFTCKGCCMCDSDWVNDLPPLEICELGKLSDILNLNAAKDSFVSFCRKCGHLLPMGRERAVTLANSIGFNELPDGLFYFTSESCFECTEHATIFVPPVTLVRVPDETQSPDKI